MSYTKIGQDGKQYFYYNAGQTWKFNKQKTPELDDWAKALKNLQSGKVAKDFTLYSLRVDRCVLIDGKQYYYVEINGDSTARPMTLARLHYLLNENKHRAELLDVGSPVRLPPRSACRTITG